MFNRKLLATQRVQLIVTPDSRAGIDGDTVGQAEAPTMGGDLRQEGGKKVRREVRRKE